MMQTGREYWLVSEVDGVRLTQYLGRDEQYANDLFTMAADNFLKAGYHLTFNSQAPHIWTATQDGLTVQLEFISSAYN